MAATDWDGATFEAHRPLLFSIAYRMLGSASEAEDVVRLRARPASRPIDISTCRRSLLEFAGRSDFEIAGQTRALELHARRLTYQFPRELLGTPQAESEPRLGIVRRVSAKTVARLG